MQLQPALRRFPGLRHTRWQLLLAGNVVATTPSIADTQAQRQSAQAITFTAVKG